MSSTDDTRCHALTSDGDRCSRSAEQGGFCYQHDEDDPTVDEQSEDEQPGDETDGQSRPEHGDGSTSNDGDDGSTGDDSDDGVTGILSVRRTVQQTAADIIGYPLDGIVAVAGRDGGWEVTLEVVERTAIPDTQDILGRYELLLDDSQTVTEYRRVGRYRRGETGRGEQP